MKTRIYKTDRASTSSGVAPERGSSARRQRILAAAKESFSRKGFHGASIADIGKLAVVNPGHIYYYFESKEELVAAVVKSELEAFFELFDAALDVQSTFDAVVESAGDAALYHTREGGFRLWLEILAESARNRKIASIVRTFDDRLRDMAKKSLDSLNTEVSGEAPGSRVSVQYELLCALVSGFAIRAVVGICPDELSLRTAVADTVRQLFKARVDVRE